VEKEFEGFKGIFNKFLQTSKTSVDWAKIEKLPQGAVCDYKTLTSPQSAEIKQMLSKLVVIKLNGGLGTSMGCRGPKSVIPVSKYIFF
jgi:UTP--glucose-1-phosphate uridylyltransferase